MRSGRPLAAWRPVVLSRMPSALTSVLSTPNCSLTSCAASGLRAARRDPPSAAARPSGAGRSGAPRSPANSTGRPRFVYAIARIVASAPAASSPGSSGRNSRTWRGNERPSSVRTSSPTRTKLSPRTTMKTPKTIRPKTTLCVMWWLRGSCTSPASAPHHQPSHEGERSERREVTQPLSCRQAPHRRVRIIAATPHAAAGAGPSRLMASTIATSEALSIPSLDLDGKPLPKEREHQQQPNEQQRTAIPRGGRASTVPPTDLTSSSTSAATKRRLVSLGVSRVVDAAGEYLMDLPVGDRRTGRIGRVVLRLRCAHVRGHGLPYLSTNAVWYLRCLKAQLRRCDRSRIGLRLRASALVRRGLLRLAHRTRRRWDALLASTVGSGPPRVTRSRATEAAVHPQADDQKRRPW